MAHIIVSSHDADRINKLATLFGVSSEIVVSRLLNYFENSGTARPALNAASEQREHVALDVAVREFRPDRLPSMVHTKLLRGTFSGKESPKASWDSLLRLALGTLFEGSRNIGDLRRIAGVNVVAGEKSDEGYKPHGAFAFSYQGMSATDVSRCILRAASALDCEASFEFEWRQKEDAEFPGERGRVTYRPIG